MICVRPLQRTHAKSHHKKSHDNKENQACFCTNPGSPGLAELVHAPVVGRSGVSQSAISRAERAKDHPTMHEQGLNAIKATLERFGVEFLGESGVRMRSQAQGEQDAGGPPSGQLSSDPFGSEVRIG